MEDVGGERVERLDSLPEDVLARTFRLLSPSQLAWVERVNRRFRVIVVKHGLWRQHCMFAHPAMADAVAGTAPDASRVPWPAVLAAAGGPPADPALHGRTDPATQPPADSLQLSAFYKRLHYRLTAPMARESLIAEALVASSTDHPQEVIDNVLNPQSRSRDPFTCYWSSTGNRDPDSREALTFRLAHPLCVVTELQLRPFRAFFQWGSPIYAPKTVRIRLGGVACFDGVGNPLPRGLVAEAALREVHAPLPPLQTAEQAGSAAATAGAGGAAAAESTSASPALGHNAASSATDRPALLPAPLSSKAAHTRRPRWVWESPEFVVRQEDALQRFPIPPTLCVGGYLRVELLGKRQVQALDGAYYACVCHLRALGTPVYTFQLRPLAPALPASAQEAWDARQRGRLQLVQPQGQELVAPLDQQQQRQGGHEQHSPEQAQAAQRDQRPPHQEQVWQLAYCPEDPLLEAGGLAAVSEGGRLAGAVPAGDGNGDQGGAADGDGGSEGGEEEMVWGDSDPDDWGSGSEDEDMAGMHQAMAGMLQALLAAPPIGLPVAAGAQAVPADSSSSDEENEYMPGGDAGAY